MTTTMVLPWLWKLSERDYLRVLALLENPPPPNARLRAAIAALPGTIAPDTVG